MPSDIVRRGLEGLARNVDRRTFLRRSMQLGFAGAVAAAAGSFGAVGRVLAMHACECDFPPYGPGGSSCTSLGYTCPGPGGCPSGCKICLWPGGSCPSSCGYDDGWWYSCGCGTYGLGCHKCYDCQCPSTSTGCNGLCGCRSVTCYCCSCFTPQDIAAEISRLAALPTVSN